MSHQKQIQKLIAELKKELDTCQEALSKAQWFASQVVEKDQKPVLSSSQEESVKKSIKIQSQKKDSENSDEEYYKVEKYPTGEEIIEGVFDGVQMVGPDRITYPVPENYASKSKLVVGDRLKLAITPAGRFVYKQIGPVPREVKRGVLMYNGAKQEYGVLVDGREYKVLKASITYYKGEPGDEVAIILPENRESIWGAIDNIVKELPRFDAEVKTPQDAPILEEIHAGRSSENAGLEEI